MKRLSFVTLILAFTLGACGAVADSESDDGGSSTDDVSEKPDEGAEDGKADRWDYRNDPDRFEGGLNHTLAELPRNGRTAHDAWPSTYWPTFHDSVQHRWTDEFSPAEKYDRAFNGWVPPEGFDQLRPFAPRGGMGEHNCDPSNWDTEYYDSLGPLATHVSTNMGNADARDGVDSDGDGQVDECDDHDGVSTWWGLCHAWVPAAMQEARPLRSVTHNGVTFHVGDMEALLILAYNQSPASVLGSRCNLFETMEEMASVYGCVLPENWGSRNDTDPRPMCTGRQIDHYVIERDAHGRAVQTECRDTNAGAMHVIAANYLGLQERPFAYDRTYDFEVWNQPIVAFDVSKMEAVDAATAMGLLGDEGDVYTYNEDAVKLYDVHASLTYITESHASQTPADTSRYERQDYYTYILEVDADGEIIGGEFYGNARERHPDFLWDPSRLTRSTVADLDLDNVRMLVEMSRQPEVSVDADVITVAGQGGVPIPDNNQTGVSATASVPTSVPIGGLRLELDITHTYIGDLTVALSHDGVERVIHNREGGSDNDIRSTLTVPGFEGKDASGTWTLRIVDGSGNDVGTLNAWKLHITPGDGSGGGGEPVGGDSDTIAVTGSGGSIPDNDGTGFVSTIDVTDSGTIAGLEVAVEITHTAIGNLKVTLSHNGVQHVLHANNGGDRDDIDQVYRITAFDTTEANGAWQLSVVDSSATDTGSLLQWGLDINVGDREPLERPTDPDAPETFPGEGGISIPDNAPAGINSEAGVPSDATGTASAVVNITHTYRGDLEVALKHDGQTWVLHDHQGGSANDLSETYVLDPAPANLGGTWTLSVSDNAAADTGTLDSWAVVVTP